MSKAHIELLDNLIKDLQNEDRKKVERIAELELEIEELTHQQGKLLEELGEYEGELS